MNGSVEMTSGYNAFLIEVKERIRSSQFEALRAVNKELVSLYWDIGRMIVERQKAQKWGKSVVQKLSADLQGEFPGIQGFSVQNLWYMRQFFVEYSGKEKLQPLVGEISWAKNLIVMSHCKDDLEREFYIRMTNKFGWSKAVLVNHIENQSYEKTLLGQTNFDKSMPAQIRNQAKFAVKDEYTFDFLELGEEHTERELERGLIGKIEHFLREMGGAFAFLGSQYRLEVSNKEYFIDLLLYHRKLKCLVAIELKVTEFQPEYAGKMQFYLAALDDLVRLPDENPSIGIILCKTKDRVIVEYALRYSDKPIGVAEYRVVKRLPKALKYQLPSPEQIEKLLKGDE
jgi:predicted nuclease of restriction endonuclease-like (RecB) superfamily